MLVLATLVAFVAYAVWYSHDRQAKVARNDECNRLHAVSPGDGSLPCIFQIVPPMLWEWIIGQQPMGITDLISGCEQSATTTDCSTLPPPSQSEPQPYVPPNPVQPIDVWISATGTPVSLSGFSFMLPPRWHGSVYEKGFAGGVHALVQSDSNDRGFTIDCPPDGKGLEAATRLSSEERTFTTSGISYSVALEEWTAPGNQSWYFVWVRAHEPGDFSTDASGTVCLAQGNATPDVATAMRTMYETWSR